MKKTHQLGGHIGTDCTHSMGTHTGHSKHKVKASDPVPQLKLTSEEQDIMDGKKGPLLQKAIRTIIEYGKLFGADCLVDLDHAPHLAMSWGTDAVEPFLKIYRDLADAGLKTYAPFTADPKPMDHVNCDPGEEKKKIVNKVYCREDELEELNLKLGMIKSAWTCACYLKEVGNTPKFGDNLAWSESSAINFSNSVIGARTNRNSMGIDMLCSILGKAPRFGLLTDEGRKATWLIDVKTSEMPHPEMIGSAIGLKVTEEIPFIAGMDRFLGEVNDKTIGYLKDLGAATASNGAVGLYHMEGITPEAVEKGRDLLADGYQTYVIDDAELARIYNSYPNLWKDKNADPQKVFLGCPHMTLEQVKEWADKIPKALEAAGLKKVKCPTYFFTSKFVFDHFEKKYPDAHKAIRETGTHLAINCPMMYLSTPGESEEYIATNSNKTRVYTTGRFFFDEDLLHIISIGKIPDKLKA